MSTVNQLIPTLLQSGALQEADLVSILEVGDGGSGLQIEGIADDRGNNTVPFEGIAADSVSLELTADGAALVINYGAGDSVAVPLDSTIALQFTDTRLTVSELIGRWTGAPITWINGGITSVAAGRTDDTLHADGQSVISGGKGNDYLVGTGGNNTYLYSLGDGADTIFDSSKADGFMAANTLRFGSGIRPSDIKLGLGSLRIQVGDNPDDTIDFQGFSASDALESFPVDRFQFEDGSTLTFADLLARGVDGSDQDDAITGADFGDQIRGHAGNDLLSGAGGDDVIDGGAGDDQLLGGAGNDLLIGGDGRDVFQVSIGGGVDTVVDGGADRVAAQSIYLNQVSARKYAPENNNEFEWRNAA